MYCIYCGKQISNDSLFCIHCGSKQELLPRKQEMSLNPVLETRDCFITDSTYYRSIGEKIQDIYTETGIQTVLSNMKIKKYNVEYYFKFLPVEGKNMLILSKEIADSLHLGEASIKFSYKIENLIIISIPLQINIKK